MTEGLDLWLDAAGKFGVPVTLLAAILFATWRVIKWFAPRVDRVLEGHVALMDTLRENDSRHIQLYEETNRGHERTHDKLDRLAEALLVPPQPKARDAKQ